MFYTRSNGNAYPKVFIRDCCSNTGCGGLACLKAWFFWARCEIEPTRATIPANYIHLVGIYLSTGHKHTLAVPVEQDRVSEWIAGR